MPLLVAASFVELALLIRFRWKIHGWVTSKETIWFQSEARCLAGHDGEV
jgi:hypothetical protein